MTTHAHGPVVETHDGNHGHGSHGHGAHGHDGHTVDIAKYVYVFIALCFLTGCSFFTYSSYWPWHDQPAVGRIFMMAVSCTKAMLVILFFMHLLWEASWKYVLTIPAAIMSVLLVLALVPDIGLRMRRASSERKAFVARPVDRGPHSPAAHDEHAPGH